MACTRSVLLAACLLLLPVAHASAQDEARLENRFAIGGEFKIKTSDREIGRAHV